MSDATVKVTAVCRQRLDNKARLLLYRMDHSVVQLYGSIYIYTFVKWQAHRHQSNSGLSHFMSAAY